MWVRSSPLETLRGRWNRTDAHANPGKAVDGLLVLSTLVMIKKRDEKERYRLIDEKSATMF